MPQEVVISQITRDHIAGLAAKGKRLDGRRFDEYRPIRLQVGHIGKAEGSCEVWLGNTRVLAGVKLKVGVPYPDSPNSGTLSTNSELAPMAAPDFEAGPPRPASIELARVVDRGIRESGLIKFDALCITPKEKIWTVFLDLHILDYDGNLFDASSLAALGAVLSAKVPNVQYGIAPEDRPLPLAPEGPPISCTTVKIGKALLSDPSLEEDQVLDTRLTVACDAEGNLRAMQKGGGDGAFTLDEVRAIIQTSRQNSGRLRELLQRAVATGHSSSADR